MPKQRKSTPTVQVGAEFVRAYGPVIARDIAGKPVRAGFVLERVVDATGPQPTVSHELVLKGTAKVFRRGRPRFSRPAASNLSSADPRLTILPGPAFDALLDALDSPAPPSEQAMQAVAQSRWPRK